MEIIDQNNVTHDFCWLIYHVCGLSWSNSYFSFNSLYYVQGKGRLTNLDYPLTDQRLYHLGIKDTTRTILVHNQTLSITRTILVHDQNLSFSPPIMKCY